MPAIMTIHIVRVNQASAAFQGVFDAMPIAAIILSYSIPDGIWRPNRIKYTHARAVTKRIAATMRNRSRREAEAGCSALCTAPGERRVLTVVLSAAVVPLEPECPNMAARSMGKREATRGRMTRVV